MSINWQGIGKLACDAVDLFSASADFLNKNRDYVRTLLKFDALFYLFSLFIAAVFSALLIALVGTTLFPLFSGSGPEQAGLSGSFLLSLFAFLALPLIFSLALLAGFIFAHGPTIAVVDLLSNKQPPSLSTMACCIQNNLGLLFQIAVTSILAHMTVSLLSSAILYPLAVLNMFVPVINLFSLFSTLVVLPLTLMIGFGLVRMTMLYRSGKRGWVQLPTEAFEALKARKEEAYAASLGLSLVSFGIPAFFNGGVLFLWVYLLLAFPVLQCIGILLPYFMFTRKKA